MVPSVIELLTSTGTLSSVLVGAVVPAPTRDMLESVACLNLDRSAHEDGLHTMWVAEPEASSMVAMASITASRASPTARTRGLVDGLERRNIAVEPRRPRVALIVMPLFVRVTRTVTYAPGFVVCGRADPLVAMTRNAREAASRSANDLKIARLAERSRGSIEREGRRQGIMLSSL